MKKSVWSRFNRPEITQKMPHGWLRRAAVCVLAVFCMAALCACKKEAPVTSLPTVQRQETTAPETTVATEPEVTEKATQEPTGHPAEFYYGTWKISKFKMQDITLSVDEWIKLGAKPSIRDFSIVFQDTGKFYFNDGTVGDWKAAENGVIIGDGGIPLQDDELVMDLDDTVLYLQKVSQDQTVPQTEAPTEETTASGLRPEFKQAMEETDGGKQAVRAILFTCSQFPGVKKVEVLVDGEKPALPEDTRSTFINDEQEVIAQYPGVVELD